MMASRAMPVSETALGAGAFANLVVRHNRA